LVFYFEKPIYGVSKLGRADGYDAVVGSEWQVGRKVWGAFEPVARTVGAPYVKARVGREYDMLLTVARVVLVKRCQELSSSGTFI